MRENLRDRVRATLAYSAIFDYPLTESEIRRWLICFSRQKTKDDTPIKTSIRNIPHADGYFALSHSKLEICIKKRLLGREVAREKWRIAHGAVRLLRCIPSLRLIGVSGGLSMNNVDAGDDIDLFVIVAPDTIWVSRLLVLSVLACLGRRRRFHSTTEKDLVCVNMFLSEDTLSLPANYRNLYTAHEVLQMEPLFEREEMYRRFLSANRWVRVFLPNAWKWRVSQVESRKYQDKRRFFPFRVLLSAFSFLLLFLEPFAKWVQKQIMAHHITTEVVSDTTLRFHPQDKRSIVKKGFLKALKQYNIPIDRHFFPELQ
jgi:hypothetical protein